MIRSPRPRRRLLLAACVVATSGGLLSATPADAEPASTSSHVLFVPVLGRGGVPESGVSAVLATVTAVAPSAPGYATAFDCSQGLPETSNVNVSSHAVPNTALVPLTAEGMLCVYRSSPMHILVDVTGYASDGSDVRPVTPRRAFDTRHGTGTTVGPVRPDDVRRVALTGDGIPADAKGVIANVTVAGGAGVGFVTLFPCTDAVPNTSNVNYVAGRAVANLATLALDDRGAVCVAASADAHVIIDVMAFLPADASFEIRAPRRLVDTRTNAPVTPGRALEVPVASASGAILNVTAARATDTGFLTVWDCDGTPPNASAVNFERGRNAAASVLADLSDDGSVCVFASVASDVVVDLQALVPAGSGLTAIAPTRVVDTRLGADLAPDFDAAAAAATERQIRSGVALDDLGQRVRRGNLTASISSTTWDGSEPARLNAWRRTRQLWSVDVVRPGGRGHDLVVVAIGATTVYVVDRHGQCTATGCSWYEPDVTLLAYDLADGSLRWEAPLGVADSYIAPVEHDGAVAVSAGDELIVLDVATGVRRWDRPAGTSYNSFGRAALDAAATTVSEAHTNQDGRIYAETVRRLDSTDGAADWATPISIWSTCQSPSTIFEGPSVTIAVNVGIATALDSPTGEVLWTHHLDDLFEMTHLGDQRTVMAPSGDLIVLLYNSVWFGSKQLVARIDGRTGAVEWNVPLDGTSRLTGELLLVGDDYLAVGGDEYDSETFEQHQRTLIFALTTGRRLA